MEYGIRMDSSKQATPTSYIVSSNGMYLHCLDISSCWFRFKYVKYIIFLRELFLLMRIMDSRFSWNELKVITVRSEAR